MGLSITDAATLITKGYKVSELAEVNTIIEANKEDDKNIIELAKKLGFSDFKTAMQLFAPADQKQSEDHKDDNQTDQNTDELKKGVDDNNNAQQSDQGTDDNVDYKKLYENEKKLREDIQKANQSKDVSDQDKKESDWDIALKFAQEVLN